MPTSASGPSNVDAPVKKRKHRSHQHTATGSSKRFCRANDSTLSVELLEDERKKYVYSPLDKGSIRIIELLPGQDDEDIRISLETIKPREFVDYSYEALSYAWGSAETVREITIELSGKSTDSRRESPEIAFLDVTKNLHEALLHIRRPDVSRRFWIDAICIDQTNPEERGTQVQMMSSIFSNSKRTTLWLGPAADDSDLVFKLFRTWTQYLAWDYEKRKTKITRVPPSAYSWMSSRNQPQALSSADFQAYVAFMNRPWFRRLWVRQEVVLSERHADVLCGCEAMSWECFRVGLWTFHIRFKSSRFPPVADVVYDLLYIHRTRFPRLLERLRRTECSDPRDRIYSIFGLIDGDTTQITNLLKSDYDITVPDLYISVCKTIMEVEKNLSILRRVYKTTDNPDLPSWVPDWRRTYVTGKGFDPCYADLWMKYPGVDVKDNQLTVKGVHVTCIKKVEPFDISGGTRQYVYRNFHRIIASFGVCETKTEHRAMVTDLIRIIQNDRTLSDFAVYDLDHRETIPLQEAVDLMAEFLELPESGRREYLIGDSDLSIEFRNCWSFMSIHCPERAALLIANGTIALGPETTEPGDIVVVVLGCSIPLILRPHKKGSYTLVGPAFVPGINYGEALVGNVPYPWKFVNYTRGDEFCPRFQNQITRRIIALDPRIDWTQLEVDKGDFRASKNLTEEYGSPLRRPDEAYLRRNHPDLKIETFKLV